MSRHDGVSCDSCLKSNFHGRRYKCLICYDYDLCATCYEAGATTTRHTSDHPMQCILTRADFDLFYGGEAISIEQPQSFTCPFCSKLGYTELSLQEHVSAEHPDASTEVVCPVCASVPGGNPNHVTDDFAGHLTLEHRTPRELISFVDEPSSRTTRRIPHPGRGVGATRARRTNMHFSSSGGLTSLSPSGNRESMDPIAELLSQLSGVRRGANASQSSTSSQLQQLQMQLQLERQQAQAARVQMERLQRRQVHSSSASAMNSVANTLMSSGGLVAGGAGVLNAMPVSAVLNGAAVPSGGQGLHASEANSSLAGLMAAGGSHADSNYLLARFIDPVLNRTETEAQELDRAKQCSFVQELLLATLSLDAPLLATVFGDAVPSDNAEKLESKPASEAPTAIAPITSEPCSIPTPPSSREHEPAAPSIAVTNGVAPINVVPQQLQVHQQRKQKNSRMPSQGGSGSSGGGVRVVSGGTGTVREVVPPAGNQMASQAGQSGRIPAMRPAAAGGAGGNSPAASRRKFLRHVDGRNHLNEPPPPH